MRGGSDRRNGGGADCAGGRASGIAAGTVYRYFPAKTDLVAALVTALADRELAALRAAAKAAPGPLSALAATISAFAARALTRQPAAGFRAHCRPVEAELDTARMSYRKALAAEFERLIQTARDGGHLPAQDATLAASALIGALIEGLIGPLAPAADDPRAQVQELTLMVLRALGVADARARGLVVAVLPS